jgi:glycogen synthase
VELLEADPSIVYVTSWSEYIDEDGRPLTWPGSADRRGYHPLGNMAPLVEELNTAGDALAVLPRRLFDLGFTYSSEVPICEDWMLARALHRAGRYGVVIPEPLVRYRVRTGSMYQATDASSLVRIREEATAQLHEEAIAWTP